MVLSDEDIIKLQALYRNELGIEIGKEDAYERGVKLLQLMSIVYKPMTEEEYKFIQMHRLDTRELLKNKIK
jgi:hypothetical protein